MDSQCKWRKSAMSSSFDVRYPTPPLCSCKMMAEIRVVMSEKKKSKDMLYYSCSTNQCGFFRWCKPENYNVIPNGSKEESYSEFKDASHYSYGGFDNQKKAHEEGEVMSSGSVPIHGYFATGYIPVAWVSCVFFLLVLVVLLIK